MTIIVFLLDTSASMNQRVFLGGRPTLLDVAKSAVETFVKVRQRSIDSRQDRYMLLTFEEPPCNIKAGWKENLATFMSELKNLQANGLTTLGNALRHTFDVLNVNRMQHGIDTYGQGKCPFYLEPSIIVCITDGGQLSSNSGVHEELKMHGSSPGFELTREPFRWDQRLFSLVLRMTGQPSGEREIGLVPSDNSPIDAMCEVTGGRSYAITSHRMLLQCIDSLVQKVQAGVVIHFEKYGPDPPIIDGLKVEEDEDEKNGKNAWQNVRRMIYVPRSNQKGFAGGFWPIPESYWPDSTLPTLPSRNAHPDIKFTCQPSEPLVVENFPFDKYELEPSPLTQFIIGRKQPTVCWQVYVQNSSRNSLVGSPFGYLKASTNLTTVNLFVMPYNYPLLLPLVDDLFRIHRLKPTSEWRAQFAMYVSSMPPYYAGPLKRALLRMGAGNIAQTIPEENYLSYSVLNYLKKLKAQAKTEYDRTCNEVALKVKSSETKRTITSFKNPFDIPRHQLLDQIARLRTLFLRPSKTSVLQHESMHNMPVGQMGNYQEYLKRMPNPLRELESAPVRQHMFGNPFKIDKRMIIDEAVDIDLLGGGATPTTGKAKKENNNSNSQINQMPVPAIPRGQKRKVGPLPKNFRFTPYKNRKTHRGMDEESDTDTESLFGSAPSSPISHITISSPTPPASPLPIILEFPNGKENSLLGSVEIFGRDSASSEPLVIDETQSPADDIMPFGAFFNSINHNDTMNDDVEDDEKDENESADEHYPYEMNGIAEHNNDIFTPPVLSISSSSSSSAGSSSYNNISNNNAIIKIEPPSGNNGTITTSLPPLPPIQPPTIKITSTTTVVLNNNNLVSTTSNHTPVSNNKVRPKVKANALKLTPESSSTTRQSSTNSNYELDDENTWRKNLELRENLYKAIRRPGKLGTDYMLSQLSCISGSYGTKQSFIKNLAREALRFKKKSLAKALEQQIEGLAPFCRPSPS